MFFYSEPAETTASALADTYRENGRSYVPPLGNENVDAAAYFLSALVAFRSSTSVPSSSSSALHAVVLGILIP